MSETASCNTIGLAVDTARFAVGFREAAVNKEAFFFGIVLGGAGLHLVEDGPSSVSLFFPEAVLVAGAVCRAVDGPSGRLVGLTAGLALTTLVGRAGSDGVS